MIFNNVDNYSVQESKYDATIAGGLMYMYENECNYNAMMKAVGISELKYYQETGKDLFLNEAGAISGFIEKAKAFFKKVIEKIKAIFHRFAAKINQFTMSNKNFVKKYSTELLKKNLSGFEFEGYKFTGTLKINPEDIKDPEDNLDAYSNDYEIFSSETLEKEINKRRGAIIGDNKEYDESDFRDKVKEVLYGDKDTIKINSIRDYLGIIANSDTEIKEFDKATKNIVKDIDKYIADLEKVSKKFASPEYNDKAEKADKVIKFLNQRIALKKALSQDYTYAIAAVSQQLTDKCKQAKAICVKALGYKHESATLEGSYSDIFSGVSII